jgi:hypothetical protein
MDINTDGPVITRDGILISAPIQTIWDIQTDVAGRPSWQPDVGGAEGDRPLTVGSVFAGRQPVWTSRRRWRRSKPLSDRVGRSRAQGIVAVHVWTLDEQDGAVLVRTAESWEGDPVCRPRLCKPPSTARCVPGWRTSSAPQNAARAGRPKGQRATPWKPRLRRLAAQAPPRPQPGHLSRRYLPDGRSVTAEPRCPATSGTVTRYRYGPRNQRHGPRRPGLVGKPDARNVHVRFG